MLEGILIPMLLASSSTMAMVQSAAAPDPSTAVAQAEGQPPLEGSDATAQAGANAQGDIVVTATRREERLQEVPVAVTAVAAGTITSAGVTDVRQLTSLVPSFNGGRNYGVSQPVIRGVGSTGVSANDESNVAYYIDGVYQPNSYANMLELVEVSRVEVLRGPQGTIFGRNATGGLVNIITPDPSYNTEGKVIFRYAKFGKADEGAVSGYFTTGLSDNVAFDFAGAYRANSGYIKDLVRAGYLGDASNLSVRSKLLLEPAEGLRFVISVDYGKMDDNSGNAVPPYQRNTVGRSVPGTIIADGPYEASTSYEPVIEAKRFSTVLKSSYDFPTVNLESTTAYQKTNTFQFSDGDASSAHAQLNQVEIDAKSLSQEVRLLSTGGGPLNWIAGAYYFNQKGGGLINSRAYRPINGPVALTVLDSDVTTESLAGFAEGTYSVTDALKLTVGLRYTTEKRDYTIDLNGVTQFEKVTSKFDKLTYRGTVQYKFSDDLNVYGTYSTGFKSGVFNTFATSPLATRPETIKALEFGVKADPLPWLRTNLALYSYDYNDLQVQARNPVGSLFQLLNAARAKIKGAELEVSAVVTDDLTLRFAGTLSDAKYKSFPSAQIFTPLPGGGNQGSSVDVSGNDLARAPDYTVIFGWNWERDLSGGELAFSGNVFHSGRVFFDFANTLSQKPYTLLSSEIAWTTPDKLWRFSLWGSNLTGERVLMQLTTASLGTFGGYEKPRKVGFAIQRNF